ncbi:MAG: TRAP transporter small permease subunit [Alphaproteobacteria bacterium]|nr:TRAP transporter small permease subunit [Alphaproteobacteria bacterium]
MSTATDGAFTDAMDGDVYRPGTATIRMLGWISIAMSFAYVVNNYLCFWQGWPGVFALFPSAPPLEGTDLTLALIQVGIYGIGILLAIIGVRRSMARNLRTDAMAMAGITNFIIRFAFWSVLLIGLIDAAISFLRVEDFLVPLFGENLATELGRSRFRGPYVHAPMLLIALVIAARSKSLGFHWLALLVVIAELAIVLSRFVFSYEQAFQGDLVRFWYGALFLFASAYTLFEDGHVRVDVLYAGFSEKTKGLFNAIGATILGLTLCWTILIFGMWSQSSIINSALLAYEVSQSGFGMYVKYWMAGFLAVFAVTMNIQFASFILENIANYREEPGAREIVPSSAS